MAAMVACMWLLGTYDAKNPVLFGPEESEDGAAYFREDAQMSSMFYNWHLNFASLMEPSKVNNSWEGRGEMYYDFHNQLAVAYNLRTAKGDWLLDWDKPIKLGYRADLVNSSGQKLSSRSSDHPPTDNGYFQEVMDIRQKFQAVRKTNSIYINESDSARLPEGSDKVTSLLADLLYNTTDSLNPAYYKSYYDAALEYVASLGSNPGQDAGGAVRYPLTALRDPAFYAIAMEVNDIIRHYRKLNTSYAKEDMVLDDVEINSLDVNNLETYFEAFDIGVTRAIENSFEWLKYTVRSLRLNHKPFETVLNITNKGDSPKDVMINIAMARSSPLPTAPVDNYQPFDRFTVQLNQGVNLIRRKSSESKIFVQEPNFVGICGIPERLALPRGSEAGVPLTFMAAVTPYDRMKDTSLEEGGGPGVHHDWELSPICGNRRFTYGKPLGFPFDRTTGDAPLTASYKGTVYHSKRKFSSSITIFDNAVNCTTDANYCRSGGWRCRLLERVEGGPLHRREVKLYLFRRHGVNVAMMTWLCTQIPWALHTLQVTNLRYGLVDDPVWRPDRGGSQYVAAFMAVPSAKRSTDKNPFFVSKV
ncbi:hypothetical protein AAG570_014075 [Ranatra chinensis]|uniref:Uncharacterized protein n=1 Tax=Ranatra chinensis TaxID=642074 RepID=A0ABD0XS04_9HEMI